MKMSKDFIEACVKVAVYAKKADTTYSHYRVSGDAVFPSRIDLSTDGSFTKAQNKGRMVNENVVGEIRGQFKVCEESPLKQFLPFKISSKIFRMVDYPQLFGWGDIAVSDKRGKAKNVEGMAVFVELGNGLVQIFFVAAKPMPDSLHSLCEYVSLVMEKGRQ